MKRVAVALLLGALLLVADERPAAADNCGGLTDCSAGVRIGLAILGIVLLAALAFFAWEFLAAAAVEEITTAGAEEAATIAAEEAATAAADEAAIGDAAAAASEDATVSAAEGASSDTAGADAAGQNRGWGNPSTLEDHFARHGADFGAPNEQAYVDLADDFYASRAQYLTKTDADGVIRVYDPSSNTFGSYNPDGSIKTFFKPTNPNYWSTQPGS
jgi:pyocin large subunit-like protein